MLLRRLIGGHTLKRATCRGFSSASGPPAISSTANWEPEELEELRRTRPNHPLLPVGPDFQCAGPIATPRFNMAAYVNQSELLQQMVKLGVAIHKWDRMEAVHGWILQKDYSSQVEPVIRFLADVGVRPDDLGAFFSKNPSILKESLEDLEVRHNYLLSKKFDREQIGRIITRNPYWLLFSTTRIDDRLGFFQKVFQLSGPEVRLLAAKEPRLITSKLDRVKVMNFGFVEEMGFDKDQVKTLLLTKPKLWLMDKATLVERFDYAHNGVGFDHATLAAWPAVLTCRDHRLRQRHRFLVHLGRHQNDPKRPNYVSPRHLVAGTDVQFAADVAKSCVLQFNEFCKTL